MRIMNASELESRGWITIFLAALLIITSILFMANGVLFGKYLLNVTIVVIPIGAYEVLRGRTKYKNMSLKRYKLLFNKNKEDRVYAILAVVGVIVGGAVSGYVGGELGV